MILLLLCDNIHDFRVVVVVVVVAVLGGGGGGGGGVAVLPLLFLIVDVDATAVLVVIKNHTTITTTTTMMIMMKMTMRMMLVAFDLFSFFSYMSLLPTCFGFGWFLISASIPAINWLFLSESHVDELVWMLTPECEFH